MHSTLIVENDSTVSTTFLTYPKRMAQEDGHSGFLMARTVVERHGGWLDVSSELGKGTQITVWLPLCEETTASMHGEVEK